MLRFRLLVDLHISDNELKDATKDKDKRYLVSLAASIVFFISCIIIALTFNHEPTPVQSYGSYRVALPSN